MINKSDITLLISTYNWPDALELVLKSVLIQSLMPQEIIIADDGSSEDTKKLIAQYQHLFTIPLKHIWHEDLGFRKSLILNKAIQQSSGDYIIQIDGDIILHKHFIKDHFNQRKEGFFVAGSRACIDEKKVNEILQNRRFDFTFFSKGIGSRFNAIHFPFLSFLFKSNPLSSWNVKGCNMAFWKSDFIKVNGYFNSFQGWGWEDYELAQRLINNGVRKKRVKWAAIGFHIFHPLNSRGNSNTNEKIYRESLTEKIIKRFPGLSEVY